MNTCKLLQMIFLAVAFIYGASLCAQSTELEAPPYLYKVLSVENWKKSQSQNSVVLSQDDAAFIHFSTKEQLNRIIEKYWSQVPEYVILKVDTAQLPGRLVYEANPGGINKYYHLYDGFIPLKAIVEAKIVRSPQQFQTKA